MIYHLINALLFNYFCTFFFVIHICEYFKPNWDLKHFAYLVLQFHCSTAQTGDSYFWSLFWFFFLFVSFLVCYPIYFADCADPLEATSVRSWSRGYSHAWKRTHLAAAEVEAAGTRFCFFYLGLLGLGDLVFALEAWVLDRGSGIWYLGSCVHMCLGRIRIPIRTRSR